MGSSFSEWGLKSKRVLSSWGLDLDLPRPPQGGRWTTSYGCLHRSV